jgi:hypothetical protein
VLNWLRAGGTIDFSPSRRGGKLYDAQWGKRMSGEGIFAEQIARIFDVTRRKAGIRNDDLELSTAAFRRADGAQLPLFS